MNRPTILTLAILFSAPMSSLAHDGPRIWLGQEAGQIKTYAADDDIEPNVYAPSRIFAVDFEEYVPGSVYATDFPGFESRRTNNSLARNTTFGFDLAGPFLKLQPTTSRLVPASTLLPAPSPQLSVSESANGIVSSTGVVAGFNHFTYVIQGNHSHLFFTLLGDGTTASNAPDGVYGIPMLLRSPTLARSDWFIVLFNKNASVPEMTASRSFATQMIESHPGDANFDGAVNFDDLLIVAANYNATAGRWWGTGDFNFDGATDFDDLLRLAANYNSTAAPAGDFALSRAVVPEPAGLFTSLVGAVALLRRRRRAIAGATIASAALLASGCDDGPPAAPIPVISPNAASTTGTAKTAQCPICVGHTIDVTDATQRLDYDGTTYYFCSDTCREVFSKDPKKHLPAK